MAGFWQFAMVHPFLATFIVLIVAYFVCQGTVYVAAEIRKTFQPRIVKRDEGKQ